MPPSLAPLAFKAIPLANPVVKGMAPDSLMAQIALEADVQSKLIVEMRELESKIAGYVPWSEFERTHGDVNEEQHTWIALGRFELRESPDGRSLRFDRTAMKFNIEKYVQGKSVSDPALTAYAQLLTDCYDQLAGYFPVLHELRECAKVMAIADWMKRHGWRMAFPEQGRVRREMPAEVRGIIHMVVTASATSSSSLSIKALLWPTGGIDRRVDASVVQLPGLGPLPVVSPVVETNEALRRILRHQIESRCRRSPDGPRRRGAATRRSNTWPDRPMRLPTERRWLRRSCNSTRFATGPRCWPTMTALSMP